MAKTLDVATVNMITDEATADRPAASTMSRHFVVR